MWNVELIKYHPEIKRNELLIQIRKVSLNAMMQRKQRKMMHVVWVRSHNWSKYKYWRKYNLVHSNKAEQCFLGKRRLWLTEEVIFLSIKDTSEVTAMFNIFFVVVLILNIAIKLYPLNTSSSLHANYSPIVLLKYIQLFLFHILKLIE